MRKIIQILIMVGLFVLGLSLPAWALNWKLPYPSPNIPGYAGREYTRQHWVDFYVNERMVGAQWNSPGSGAPRFSGYCSVFDLPPNYDEGYTAIGNNDEVVWNAAMILDALGVANVDNWWIISPAYWKKYGIFKNLSPFSSSGEMINDVPVYNTNTGFPDGSKPALNPARDTIDSPVCFKNGPNGFCAGGVHEWWYNGAKYTDPRYWYSESSDPHSPVAVTSDSPMTEVLAKFVDMYTRKVPGFSPRTM